MTDGLLVARAFNNESFEGYHTIIIDEAHESNANIALLLVLAKQAIVLRKGELKVIVMSANIPVDRFVRFFEDSCAVTKIAIPGELFFDEKTLPTIWFSLDLSQFSHNMHNWDLLIPKNAVAQ
jgi:HrpA-like RNA helicase